MSNLIRQKTTFATDAQHPSTQHQQFSQEALVKELALVTADHGKAPDIWHWLLAWARSIPAES